MKSRKSLSGLIVISLLIALATVAGGQTRGGGASPKKTIEGSWKVTVTPGPSPIPFPPAFESIVTYVPGVATFLPDLLVGR